MKNKKISLVICAVILIISNLCSCAKVNEKDLSNVKIEEETVMANVDSNVMQDFSCETNKGDVFKLYERNDGKPVFINFWATWCGPCVGEMPDLQDIYDEYKDKVDFIFINCGDSKDIISSFLNVDGNSFTFPIGYDENNDISMKFNITGIPTTHIVDKDNKIIDKLIGARSGSEYSERIKQVID